MLEAQQFAIYPSLRNRVVLVTGGATGIGAAMVEAFAAQGARVAFFDLDAAAGEALVAKIVSSGAAAPMFAACDLTDTVAAQTVLHSVEEMLGPLDVLINNAANDVRHTIEEVTPERWDDLIAVNLKHQFFMAQAALASMKTNGRGVILNMGSIAWAIPSTDLPVYTTAKAAIMGMTKSLAHIVGKDGVRVNSIMPGAILTEKQRRLWLTPEYEAEVLSSQALKRLIEPNEVARLALFLAADDSAAITGQSYVIDGGWV